MGYDIAVLIRNNPAGQSFRYFISQVIFLNQEAGDEHDYKFFSVNESDSGEYRNSSKFKTFTPATGKNLLAICSRTQEFIFYLPASKSLEMNLNGDLRVSFFST